MSDQGYSLIEDLKDTAYSVSTWFMIGITTFMSGYISWQYLKQDSYITGIFWFVVTIATAFQVPLWSKIFNRGD